jgi:hypothetical protein
VAQPKLEVCGIVFNAPDPRELAEFYSKLLGWGSRTDEPAGSRWQSPAAT